MHVRHCDFEGFSSVTIQYSPISEYHNKAVYELLVKSVYHVVLCFEEDYLGLPSTRGHSPFDESFMQPGGTWHYISALYSSPSNQKGLLTGVRMALAEGIGARLTSGPNGV
jgi:hypothetical protein